MVGGGRWRRGSGGGEKECRKFWDMSGLDKDSRCVVATGGADDCIRFDGSAHLLGGGGGGGGGGCRRACFGAAVVVDGRGGGGGGGGRGGGCRVLRDSVWKVRVGRGGGGGGGRRWSVVSL